MARPSRELIEAAKPYVCVRVVDMKGVDLEAYRFDWALTFAALLMHADGTVYHRFGAGDSRDPTAHLSEAGLARMLRETVAEHAAYIKAPAPPPKRPKRTVEDFPDMKRRPANKRPECFHCHTVGDLEREAAQAEGKWKPESVWRQPSSARIGIALDRDDPALIKEVRPGGPAAAAGLAANDRLVLVAGVRTMGEADVRFALDAVPYEGGDLPLEFVRGGETKRATARLSKGWRAGDALELAWRNDMWSMRPNPGFGGPELNADEKRALGLKPEAFALRVGYLIDFGPHPEDGRNAKKAGIRKGDVVVAVDGRSVFVNERHFQTWYRLTKKAGQTAEIDLVRGGERVRVNLPVLP